MLSDKLINDRWINERKGRYGNVEPIVTLTAISAPLYDSEIVKTDEGAVQKFGFFLHDAEELPARSAAISYGSQIIDREKALRLNKLLLHKGHHTPMESVQLNFLIENISKACSAQMSRHRTGTGHVSSSRRYQNQKAAFVYPILEDINDILLANEVYDELEKVFKESMEAYLQLRDLGIKKGDARYCIPASSATHRHMWINVRALRHFFSLRLVPEAETEIRRVACMMFDLCVQVLPSLFEDMEVA